MLSEVEQRECVSEKQIDGREPESGKQQVSRVCKRPSTLSQLVYLQQDLFTAYHLQTLPTPCA